MKKLMIGVFALVIVGTLFYSCSEDNTKIVKNYEVNTTSANMDAGTSAIFTAGIADVTWKSLAPAIATVEKGVITAISEGVVTIVAENVEEEFKQSFIITIEAAAPVYLTTDANKYSVTKDESIPVLIKKNGIILNEGITYKSSDEKIFTITDGIITGLSKGIAYLDVTVDELKTRAVVIVTEIAPELVKNITLSNNNVNLVLNQTFLLTTSVYPQNADNAEGVWSSSDENIVSVNDGELNAHKVGKATISYTCGNVVGKSLISVTLKPLMTFYYGEMGESYSIGSLPKGATKGVKSILPTINVGASVKYFIVNGEDEHVQEFNSFSIDKNGIISTTDLIKVNSYKIKVGAECTFRGEKITKYTEVEFTSKADFGIGFISDGSYFDLWMIHPYTTEAYFNMHSDKLIRTFGGELDLESVKVYFANDNSGKNAETGEWNPAIELDNSDEKYFKVHKDHIEFKYLITKSDPDDFFLFIFKEAHEVGDPNNKISSDCKMDLIMSEAPLLSFEYKKDNICNFYKVEDKVISSDVLSLEPIMTKGAKCFFDMVGVSKAGAKITEKYFELDYKGVISTISKANIPAGIYSIEIKATDISGIDNTNIKTAICTIEVIEQDQDLEILKMTKAQEEISSDFAENIFTSNLGELPTNFSYELDGDDASNFSVDTNGNIKLNTTATINPKTYNFTIKVMDNRNTSTPAKVYTEDLIIKVI